MPATLKDIAKKSGFSVTTVSRALSGYDDVNPGTREHIVTIADELGYQPNHSARQLQGQKTHTIGLVIAPPAHNPDDDFYSLLLKGLTYAAAHSGYDILASAPAADATELDVYQRIVGSKRVDGMVVARTNRDDRRIAYLQSVDCPFIVHGRAAPDATSNFHYIDVDSQQGIMAVTQHLLERGHTHVGIILPAEQFAFSQYRQAGYMAALAAYNIMFRPEYCAYGTLTLDSGYTAACQLLSQQPQLTAIVGCNDWMALGAMKAVNEAGYTIGKDFAVAGYDDIPAAAHASTSLTTVRQPIYAIGEMLIARLLTIINDDPTTFHQTLIEPELVIRDSSGG